MEKLRVPSDADLMKIAIADLHNVTLPTEDRKRALEELLILVEPIDNANGIPLYDFSWWTCCFQDFAARLCNSDYKWLTFEKTSRCIFFCCSIFLVVVP